MAARASPRSRPVSPVVGTAAALLDACSANAEACFRKSATTASTSARASRKRSSSRSFRRCLNVSSRWRSASSRDARAAVGLGKRLALALDQPALMLERAQVRIDLRKVLGELRFALRQVLPRAVDDRRVQPETPGHLERQAPARRSVLNAIRRLERVRRKAKPRGSDSGRRRGIGLQCLVVRRGDHDRAARAEVLDDGDAQRAAFERIRPGAELVEQHERRAAQASDPCSRCS